VYGLGDVATSLVSLLLLPIFTRYLTPSDYGIITLLLTIEAVTKIAFRWGVDTAFMRLYYDYGDEKSRQRLASTIFFFLGIANGALLVAALAAAPWLSAKLYGTPEHGLLIGLTIANTFVAGFYFIPFQVLRIGERSSQFIVLAFVRSAGTIVARLALVVWAGLGVMGVVIADLLVTGAFSLLLIRWFRPLIKPVFSWAVLRDALRFGLPRVPHSAAHQVMGFADRYLLSVFGTLRDVGLYSIGATFGLALKLFLSAFEAAWTPFFLGVMREPDARRIYGTVSTYVVAALVLLVAVLCAIAPALVRLFTTVEFHAAADVTPWIAVGVMFQGFYLVGSIGLVTTKRTSLYPVATGAAAGVSLLANSLLIPRFGMLGAAWANVMAYATLAIVTISFSWHVYPIQYEWGRLLRIAVAGAGSYVLASRAVSMSAVPAVGLLLSAGIVFVVYAGLLYLTGFFHAGELRVLGEIRSRVLQRARPAPVPAVGQTEVEMAGAIAGGQLDSTEEPVVAEVSGGRRISPDSRFPGR
jgi:O-antigen/teichoic acid export membrane protein